MNHAVPHPSGLRKGANSHTRRPFDLGDGSKSVQTSAVEDPGPGLLCGLQFDRDERTGGRDQRESVGSVCAQFGAGVRFTWSMLRPTISLVALCGAHVGVPFESGEYLSRGAAIHDPIEGGAPVRQPDVEPSNKLQLVPSGDLLLGALRLRGTKDCNDLSRFYRCRTRVPLQVHLVLCGYEAPSTNQQCEYGK